jgi:hypothetical protein
MKAKDFERATAVLNEALASATAKFGEETAEACECVCVCVCVSDMV